MMAETWEITARRIIKEHNLIGGYSYDCSYRGGCKDVHEKDTIPIYIPNTVNDVCIGTIYRAYGELDVYGRQYMEIAEKLLDALEKETGESYAPTLKEENPRIKSWWEKNLFPYLGLWSVGCLGICVFAWVGIMFCYCLMLFLIRIF